MKAIFNDGTELQIQQAYLAGDGALRIKVISAVATQEKLRAIFEDATKTKKITIQEHGQNLNAYENYTQFEGITLYNAGILEPFLYKAGETPAELLEKAQKEIAELKEQNNMLQECVLEMSELVYQ